MLQTNAMMTFTSYKVEDGGIRLNFVCFAPGAGEPTDYSVFVSDAELASVSNLPQFKTLIETKLKRLYRATGIATKLDPYIGQSLVI